MVSLSEFAIGLLVAFTSLSLTFIIHHRLGLGPVFASSVIMIITGSLSNFIHDFVINIAVTSSFAGMSSPQNISNSIDIITISFIITIVYFSFFSFFRGLGGTLGMIAFVSVTSLVAIKTILK
ncbi:MAG: hypothetical protein N3C60_00060 [Calditerrivibrio sp.]|nr:hypothetical protein [Calditerrivibrio sp.]